MEKELLKSNEFWRVKRFSQYKLGNSPFKHDESEDKDFDTEEEALDYVKDADSGFFGDTRFRYEIFWNFDLKLEKDNKTS